MALFQKAPQTLDELEQSKPLDMPPEEVAELDEHEWYERAYRGDNAPQLTPRAVLMGGVLGFFLAFTNVYLGLKTGWHIGVALTACILSFSIWTVLLKGGAAKTPMTILENNCMQSLASSAGYSTGSTMVSAIPALLLLSISSDHPKGQHLPWPVLAAWTLFIAALGVVVAIPMKRNMINQEKLRFPSGTAAAVMLKSLYSQGSSAVEQGKALFYAAMASGLIPLLKDLQLLKTTGEDGKVVRDALLPGTVKLFDFLPGIPAMGKVFALSSWNIKLDYGPALIAAGALVGVRVTLSMVGGGLILALFVGPMGLEAEWLNPAGHVVTAASKPATVWKELGVWFGAPMLVSAGLLSFVLQWRTIARAFKGLLGNKKGSVYRSTASEQVDHAARAEVPISWFVAGGLVSGGGIVVIAWHVFKVPVYFGALAVLLTFGLAMVASRSTGESDVTPTGAMGKIMQLTYGVLIPQNATANLMTAGITAGASAASGDLLTDLKAGYLLGANPRRQFVAQLLGVLPGTVATVLAFYILVPDTTSLTGVDGRDPAFPAPAAQQWKAVAEVFQSGIENMHPLARQGIFWGLLAGAVLVLLERALPRFKKYLPSAMGIGLGMILPFYSLLSMFIGALAAALAERRGGKVKELVVPVASGLIAGESIVGVVVAALNNFVLN